jgi:D-cysteine desulfhydrase family pyridoxal phosphate-dependent enzyme
MDDELHRGWPSASNASLGRGDQLNTQQTYGALLGKQSLAIDPRLQPFPKVSLAHVPTPLEHLPRLSRRLGGPDIWVKRDDCTGLGFGGNKARKLEYLIGEAQALGSDVVITTGAKQSNHARQTAVAAARVGMGCELVLTDSVPGRTASYQVNGNVMLDHLFGAEIRIVAPDADSGRTMSDIAETLRSRNHRPYIIPVGGSNEIGTLGYVAAAGELVSQCRQRGVPLDCIVLPTASAGTHAGLLVGFALQQISVGIIGFSVGRSREQQQAKVESLITRTNALLRFSPAGGTIHVNVDDNYAGLGYGNPSLEMLEAVRLVAEEEGLLLDPVYSGKAMAGLIARIRQQKWATTSTVIFLHTGGGP